jgi:hypothetical protein
MPPVLNIIALATLAASLSARALARASIIVVLGLVCARLLRQTRPVDAGARPDVQPYPRPR